MSPPLVVVAGALAAKPGNGGEAWVRASWVRGLLGLGCAVWFVEQVAPDLGDGARGWFTDVTSRFGFAERATLVAVDGPHVRTLAGADVDLAAILDEADLLVNISGNLRDSTLLQRCARRAFVDLDPGFTQIWAATGVGDLGLDRHDVHFTVGERIGTSSCALPTAGYRWSPCRQPVVLDDWPALALPDEGALTTVATWRCGHGAVHWAGTDYGLKVHEFRRISDLPRHTSVPLELALDIHPGDDADRTMLVDRGWRVRPAGGVAGTADAFRSYVQMSMGELTVAQSVYAQGRTGWFSDRTVRYLATGRPAIVQDTGWADGLDIDAGLVTFTDLDGARRAVNDVWVDLERHAKAARAIAEEHFASDTALAEFLTRADVNG